MEWKFECAAGPFGFTEGPVGLADALLFTDMPNDRVLRYDAQTDAPRATLTLDVGYPPPRSLTRPPKRAFISDE